MTEVPIQTKVEGSIDPWEGADYSACQFFIYRRGVGVFRTRSEPPKGLSGGLVFSVGLRTRKKKRVAVDFYFVEGAAGEPAGPSPFHISVLDSGVLRIDAPMAEGNAVEAISIYAPGRWVSIDRPIAEWELQAGGKP